MPNRHQHDRRLGTHFIVAMDESHNFIPQCTGSPLRTKTQRTSTRRAYEPADRYGPTQQASARSSCIWPGGPRRGAGDLRLIDAHECGAAPPGMRCATANGPGRRSRATARCTGPGFHDGGITPRISLNETDLSAESQYVIAVQYRLDIGLDKSRGIAARQTSAAISLPRTCRFT